ncbi:HNH endonuclease family protein [Amycolatopsis sp. NPDC004079]|uniref:HNH endonuclease family protein n=1 Tax=Amycolatopsis sp. NPDC004079 TaxID=3154549 RepID=UPI0033A730DC
MTTLPTQTWCARKTVAWILAGVAAVALLAGCNLPSGAGGGSPAGEGKQAGQTIGTAPNVPLAEARKQLAELPVAPRGTLDGYDRDKKFPHWKTVSGTCNVREEVLKRDGTNVRVNAECAPVSGNWHSVYDGETWPKASNVDIDHVVPLAHAWISGAKAWPQAKREQFANDLVRPQLIAVTGSVNRQKSDKAPDEWKPPLVSFWCTYATDWTVVKREYGLTVTVPERTALSSMLDRC